MKIAVVRKQCSLHKGGAERYCVDLVRQLIALGNGVTVVSETIDPELRDEFRFLPVRVNHATSWTKNRSFFDNAGQVVADGSFDIVFGLSHTQPLDVFRVTDRIQAHWLNVYYRHRLNRFLQGLNPRHRTILDLEQRVYQSPSLRRVITESKLDQRLVSQYYGVPQELIRTVYDGVDTELFHPGVRDADADVRQELNLQPSQPLLVFASMDFEGKGLRTILEAIALVGRQDLRLAVLGKGKINRFRRVASRLGVAEQVLFLGRRGDIERFYGAGDLFVLPTLYEPFGLVHLEALACGLPVITSATAGGADVVRPGKNGYVIRHARASEELAHCLRQHLALSPGQQNWMRQRCWHSVQKLTLERNARETLDVFEEALCEKRRAA